MYIIPPDITKLKKKVSTNVTFKQVLELSVDDLTLADRLLSGTYIGICLERIKDSGSRYLFKSGE